MTKLATTIVLDSKIKKALETRAKKELMSVEELIADILRRSVVSYNKGTSSVDNVDDKFLTFFSRKTQLRKKKKIK